MEQGGNTYPHFFREMDQLLHVQIVVKLTAEPDFLMPGPNLPWVLCSCQPLERGSWDTARMRNGEVTIQMRGLMGNSLGTV